MSNIDLAVTSLLPSSYTHIIATQSIKTTPLVPLWELAHCLLTCAFLYPIMKVEPFFKKNIWQGRWRRLFSRATLLPSLLVTHIIATPARKSTILVPLFKLSHWVWHGLEIWAIIGHTKQQVTNMELIPLGANRTQINLKNGDSVFFSYRTPVASLTENGYYRTSKKWSVTTTRHINKWLGGVLAKEQPQEYFDSLVVGSVPL